MANLTKYQENAWLTLLKAATTYVGLISNSANEAELEGDTPTVNEITGYTGDRKEISFGAISKAGTAPSEMDGPTPAVIEFANMPAPAGRTIQFLIICDHATAGNPLAWSEITAGPKTWNTGDTFRIPVDGITVRLD